MTPADLLADPWAFGPWCWVVDEVRLLPHPLPCRGMQGLWPLRWREGGEAMLAPPERRVAWALSHLVPEVDRLNWSALTLLQPYASAVASGHKRVENRPWRRAIPPGGMWVGLHAGKTLYTRDGAWAREDVKDALDEWREGLWPDAPPVDELPLGVMLGAMHIAACLPYPKEGA